MKLSHLLLWFVLISCVASVGVVGWRMIDQPVVSVKIDGLLTDHEIFEVRAVVQNMLPQSLLRIDTERLVDHLDALGWPERVYVRRVWPDRLFISISKPSVVARWREGGVLTSRGEVVFMDDPAFAVLPELSAEIASPGDSMNRFEGLNSLLGESPLRLTGLHQNQLGEWQVQLNQEITIKLGAQDIHDRFRRALVVYARVHERQLMADHSRDDEHQVAGNPVLDARYQNGVAVSWPAMTDQLVAYGQ